MQVSFVLTVAKKSRLYICEVWRQKKELFLKQTWNTVFLIVQVILHPMCQSKNILKIICFIFAKNFHWKTLFFLISQARELFLTYNCVVSTLQNIRIYFANIFFYYVFCQIFLKYHIYFFTEILLLINHQTKLLVGPLTMIITHR